MKLGPTPFDRTELRDQIARILLKNRHNENGVKAGDIKAELGIGDSKLYKALDHAWFRKSGHGMYELTAGGLAAAEVVAAAP